VQCVEGSGVHGGDLVVVERQETHGAQPHEAAVAHTADTVAPQHTAHTHRHTGRAGISTETHTGRHTGRHTQVDTHRQTHTGRHTQLYHHLYQQEDNNLKTEIK